MAGNFKPIGSAGQPFTGRFIGGGYALRNLTIKSASPSVGLFGWIDGGMVSDVRFRGVAIRSTRDDAHAGAVAGDVVGNASIDAISVGGRVQCTGEICRVGGILGRWIVAL